MSGVVQSRFQQGLRSINAASLTATRPTQLHLVQAAPAAPASPHVLIAGLIALLAIALVSPNPRKRIAELMASIVEVARQIAIQTLVDDVDRIDAAVKQCEIRGNKNPNCLDAIRRFLEKKGEVVAQANKILETAKLLAATGSPFLPLVISSQLDVLVTLKQEMRF